MGKLREVEGGRKDEFDAIAYTNRKGQKYFLFQVKTKTGKARYVFRRNIEGQGKPVFKIPSGHEIAESVNGIVSLRKAVESPLRAEELEIVRSILKKHEHLARYRADDVKGDIVVFEPIGGASPEVLKCIQSFNPLFPIWNLESLERRVQYSPVLRFRLVDEKKRRFHTERMTYRCEGGMMPLMNGNGTIREVAERFCGKLGRDSFFELF
jgi:hypothetical protein